MATKIFESDNEEAVHYWLFPHDPNGLPITDKKELEELSIVYMAHLHSFTHDYIWHSDPFSLQVKMKASFDSQSEVLGPHLGGSMVVGDYLEDEWFVFFLLVNLTTAHPNIVCRIVDKDGEFPLIEAALHLPSWADPETADQRVFLKQGLLHIIPPSVTSAVTGPPPIMESVASINSLPSSTLANPAIQNAIHLRIEEYPRKISKEHHSTHAYVPVAVAALLKEYPTLVSPAVKAFCNRDVKDSKCLRVMRHFPPETRVMTSVRFSKALYALMSSHPYIPDPCTGWDIPKDNNNNNAHVLGMKLACGFEILVCSAGGVTPSITPSITSEDLQSEIQPVNNWGKYKASLANKGYFRGEREGSKLYKELEVNAHRFFVSNNLMSRDNNDDMDALTIGSVVLKLLSKVNADYDKFKERETLLLPPDDEKWLEITPDTFDEFLELKFKTEENAVPRKSSDQEMANALNAFLEQTSSYEGLEVPPELLQKGTLKTSVVSEKKKESTSSRKISMDPSRKHSGLLSLHPQHRKISSHSNASDASDLSSFSAKVDFNADSFTDALNNILEFSVPEDEYFNQCEEDSSGMSSYEDEDVDLSLSRKTSDGSSVSKSSSGVCADLNENPTPSSIGREKNPSKSNKKKIPLAQLDDEFADLDIEDDRDAPLNIDMKAVSQLLECYSMEGGTGPTSVLLESLGMGPSMKQ